MCVVANKVAGREMGKKSKSKDAISRSVLVSLPPAKHTTRTVSWRFERSKEEVLISRSIGGREVQIEERKVGRSGRE